MAYFKCKGFNGYIDVYGVANATVTATASGQSFSEVADANGYARIKVRKMGIYTIASSGTPRAGYATVTSANPVTAHYIWQKWDSVKSYYQSTQNYTAVGSISSSTDIWTGLGSQSVYYDATSYSFSSSTGLFTMSGGSIGTTGGQTMVKIWRYTGYPNGSSNISSQIVQNTGPAPEDEFTVRLSWYLGSLRLTAGGRKVRDGKPGTAVRRYASYSWIKGSTQYENTTATTLSAYPTNGRYATDGYWYIAS